jgi:hypothetical protein
VYQYALAASSSLLPWSDHHTRRILLPILATTTTLSADATSSLAWPHSFPDCLLTVHQALGGGENGDVNLEEPRAAHRSMSLVLPLPAGSELTTTPPPVTSAFADGELRAGKHFNALMWWGRCCTPRHRHALCTFVS